MFKVLRYLIIVVVVVVGLSALRGVNAAFSPGLESPPEFIKNITSGAGGVVSGAILGVSNTISKKVSDSIESRATEEVTKNFNNLGDKEKEILKKAICQ